jgi:arylsulfatase A-like enzyme
MQVGLKFASKMILMLSLFCHAALGLADDSAEQQASPPNIVLIFADDLGYGDVGCYGATHVRTPHIDRIATEGRLFTDAHSASAACSPSRYCLLTGTYAFRRNLYGPVFLKAGLQIEPDRPTVASLMKRHGYSTACIGKWHLGFGQTTPDWNGDLKPGPLECGFDYYFGVPVVNSHPPFVYVENHRVVGLDPEDPFVFGQRADTQEFPEKRKLSDIGGAQAAHALYKDREVATRLTENAVQWIQDHRQEPFFLYFPTTNIHHPFTPREEFDGSSDAGRYGDFVHELDWSVGQILKTLDDLQLTQNTLLIFTSDNGGMLNEGGQNAWKLGHRLNGDLLGFKFGAWEGGHRVPFLARWPGHIPAGSRSDQLISSIDVMAMLASVMKDRLRENEGLDSFDILPALVGNPAQPIRDHLVLAPIRRNNLTLRQGKWVYIGAKGSGGFGGNRGGPGALAFTSEVNSDIGPRGRFKPNAPPAQLYDLKADLTQSTNVYNDHPEVVRQMQQRLAEIKAAVATRPL